MAACQEVAQSRILRQMTYSRCLNCARVHGASFLRCSECGADNAAFISVELSWTPMGQLRSVVAER